jgi:hypothetical protein
MTPRLRRFSLTAHVVFSVGWLGAVGAYLAPAIAGLTSQDAQLVRASYLTMELIGWCVIVPCSLAALLTGLVQSLGTEWGLVRHYWILVKFVLSLGATLVLLVHMRAVSHMSGLAARTALSSADFGLPRLQLVVHAGGGLLVLLTATALSVYKPWGRTPFGLPSRLDSKDDIGLGPARTPRGRYVLLGIIGLVLLFVVLHLIGGGLRAH